MAIGGARMGEALSAAVDALTAAGIDTPRLDAEVMLAGIAGIGRAELIVRPETEIHPSAARRFSEAVRRRLRREPVAYILGSKGFRQIELMVDSRVLIPRPETEMLVELALENDPARLLEIGTGSGAIALAAADEIPGCRIVATDTSEPALQVARANTARLGFTDRVEFHAGPVPAPASLARLLTPDSAPVPDGAAAVPDGPAATPSGPDLILANLPYVPDGTRLAPELTDWEPSAALFGGPDGTDVIATVLNALGAAGVAAAVIGLEIGQGQGERVTELLQQAGYDRIEVRPDLAGIERVVVGYRDQAGSLPDLPA